jgi:hypothetical protein
MFLARLSSVRQFCAPGHFVSIDTVEAIGCVATIALPAGAGDTAGAGDGAHS